MTWARFAAVAVACAVSSFVATFAVLFGFDLRRALRLLKGQP